MNVQDAIATRRSVRDFLDTPVPGDVIRRVLAQALRAPSGGNLQPWHLHVVGGDRLSELKTRCSAPSTAAWGRRNGPTWACSCRT